MVRPGEEKEKEHDKMEQRWRRRQTGTFVIAFLVVALDILALALGTIIPEAPVALSVGCVGVITFVGVLVLTNYLSRDLELAKKEIRKAIAASFTLVYLVFLALVVFGETSPSEAELAKTVVGHFTWIVGIIIIFYFGSRMVEYLRKPEQEEGEKQDNASSFTKPTS